MNFKFVSYLINIFKQNINLNFLFKNKSVKGFTLIELMVSTSLFTFVSIVAIASLVMMQDMNLRLKATRNLYDSMFLVMDDITRELKQGGDYKCSNSSGVDSDGASCDNNIRFTPFSSEYVINPNVEYCIEYVLYGSQIIKNVYSINCNNILDPTAPPPIVTELTLDNVKITKFDIKINNLDRQSDSDNVQPSVILNLEGETKEKLVSTFNFEAYVTQRLEEDQS